MKYTKNYHLPQWAETDRIMMEDFNQMCTDMEAGLEAVKAAAEEGDQALAEEQAQQAGEIAALRTNLGGAGKNARIAWGSYKGTGLSGANNPTTLTFDFYPVVVIFGCDEYAYTDTNPTVLVRGRTSGCPDNGASAGNQMTLSWTEHGVSFYSTENPAGQNNSSIGTYYYAAIGYDKEAEEA